MVRIAAAGGISFLPLAHFLSEKLVKTARRTGRFFTGWLVADQITCSVPLWQ
jgi:hypothetical protein